MSSSLIRLAEVSSVAGDSDRARGFDSVDILLATIQVACSRDVCGHGLYDAESLGR